MSVTANAKALQELAGTITAKRSRLSELLGKNGLDGAPDRTPQEVDEFKALVTELNDDLGPRYDRLTEEARLARENDAALKALRQVDRPGFMGYDGVVLDRHGREVKSLGELFVEAPAYKAFQADKRVPVELPDYDIKTLFQTSAGWAPESTRRPGVVYSAQQQPRVVDLIPSFETTQAAIKWMLETTYTNAAAETAEAGTYAESAAAATEQTTAVKKIAVTLPATDEQLDDVPAARDYLNNRLTLQLRQRLDLQLVVGNGVGANLTGLLNVPNIQTQAKGADPDFDAILKAIVKVQSVGFAEPSGVLMNPIDWQNLRLIRSNGLYVLGYPGESAAPRIWGLPVVTTTYVTLHSALVADFANYTELWYRKGITFDYTTSHGTEFVTGTQRFRAQMRVAFVVTRPTAVCAVTGLAGN